MAYMWQWLQIGFRIVRPSLWLYVLAVPVGWALVALSGPEFPEQQWLWLEAVWIPAGLLIGLDALAGRHERHELELLLARLPARRVSLLLTLPLVVCLILSSMLITMPMATGSLLVAVVRPVMLFGVVQLLYVLTRSRWLTLTLFSLWWLFGLVYMSDWAGDARTAVLVWHPMRVSGGGGIVPELEALCLGIGAACLILAWWAAGREGRWL